MAKPRVQIAYRYDKEIFEEALEASLQRSLKFLGGKIALSIGSLAGIDLPSRNNGKGKYFSGPHGADSNSLGLTAALKEVKEQVNVYFDKDKGAKIILTIGDKVEMDSATQMHQSGSGAADGGGYWRMFEGEGAFYRSVGKPGKSSTHGFLPNRRSGGITGQSVKMPDVTTGNTKLKTHPGINKVQMFQLAYKKNKRDFARQVKNAVRTAISVAKSTR